MVYLFQVRLGDISSYLLVMCSCSTNRRKSLDKETEAEGEAKEEVRGTEMA